MAGANGVQYSKELHVSLFDIQFDRFNDLNGLRYHRVFRADPCSFLFHYVYVYMYVYIVTYIYICVIIDMHVHIHS